MIPANFHEAWKYGISSGEYSLKLCGSGGGGYILGFLSDPKKADSFFKKADIRYLEAIKIR